MVIKRLVVVSGALSLGACAALPPAGPSVLAIPSQGKPLGQFQGEEASCRDYARSRLPDAGQVQKSTVANGVGSTLLGTAIGAGAGAAIGSIGAAAGAGAAVGAVAGTLIGGSVAANGAAATSAGLQQTYDVAYIQCMASKGDTVESPPAPVAYGYGYGYPYPYYYPPFGFVGVGFGPRFYYRHYYR